MSDPVWHWHSSIRKLEGKWTLDLYHSGKAVVEAFKGCTNVEIDGSVLTFVDAAGVPHVFFGEFHLVGEV